MNIDSMSDFRRIARAQRGQCFLMKSNDRIDVLDFSEISTHTYEQMLKDLMLVERKGATASNSTHRIVKLMVEADAKRQVAFAVRPKSVDRFFHCGEVFRA